MRSRAVPAVVGLIALMVAVVAAADVVPIDKECVGDPPRQTEDPLSPPCVPYYSGDNGGETARGVTGEEIRVVFYNDLGIEGDMTAPFDPSRDGVAARTVKAQLAFFQERFQTYGRTVLMHAVTPPFRYDHSRDTGRIRDAVSMRFKYDPFAAIAFGPYDVEAFVETSASLGVVTHALRDLETHVYEDHASYVWSFWPDLDVAADLSAGFICRSLRGGVARFSPDLSMQDDLRKIALVYNRANVNRPYLAEQAEALEAAVAGRCGGFDLVIPFDGGTLAGAKEAALIVGRLRLAGVTTVVCYCMPFAPEGTVSTLQSVATATGYFPEWYWDSATGMDHGEWQRAYGNKAQVSIGSSHQPRNPAIAETFAYRAYQQATGDGSEPDLRFNADVYTALLTLFTAVQSAGPTVTVPNNERGLFTMGFLRPSYPWVPTGAFGEGFPGTYSFVDTGMAWWWDPAGTSPEGRAGEGCARVAWGGVRFYADTWPEGDAHLFTPGAECTADPWQALP